MGVSTADLRSLVEAHEPSSPRETSAKVRFLAELDRLERDHTAERANVGSYQCEKCEACSSCMFCKGCTSCYRCTHCTQADQCTHCSHCVRCEGCHSCAYCVDSRNCSGSAYLVRCLSCADCDYCFGCVGLVKKDFHILNVPYPRQEYFEIVKKLKRELGIKE